MASKKSRTVFSGFLGLIKFLAGIFVLFTLISAILILFFRFVNPPVSAFMLSKMDTSPIQMLAGGEIKHHWISLKEVSKYVPLAVIASEDQAFFDHFGFDFNQIEKAMKENVRRKRIRGASTISQQVAKNLFLWPGKNIIRKGVEAYYTLLIELLWSKERILEVYINIAEMGKDIYGADAAARFYYKKPASRVSMGEAAMMAAVLPNPIKMNIGRPSGYMLNRRARIQSQMNMIGGLQFLKENL